MVIYPRGWHPALLLAPVPSDPNGRILKVFHAHHNNQSPMASLADKQPPAPNSRDGRRAMTPEINGYLHAEEFLGREMVISSVSQQ